jgi:hypothetical protein
MEGKMEYRQIKFFHFIIIFFVAVMIFLYLGSQANYYHLDYIFNFSLGGYLYTIKKGWKRIIVVSIIIGLVLAIADKYIDSISVSYFTYSLTILGVLFGILIGRRLGD